MESSGGAHLWYLHFSLCLSYGFVPIRVGFLRICWYIVCEYRDVVNWYNLNGFGLFASWLALGKVFSITTF